VLRKAGDRGAWIGNCSARWCINPPRKPPCTHATRDPNGATDGCDGPDAVYRGAERRDAARRSVPRPADGVRGRSDGQPRFYPRFQSVVVCLIGRRLVRQPTRVALFSLPLSLSLSVSPSFFPRPVFLSTPAHVRFSFFFLSTRVAGEFAGVGLGVDHVARVVCVRGRGSGGVFLTPARELCCRATCRLVHHCVRFEKNLELAGGRVSLRTLIRPAEEG